MYTGSEDGSIRLWDLRASNPQREFWNYPRSDTKEEGEKPIAINSVCLHPDQGQLIFGDQQGRVRVIDLGTMKSTHNLLPESDNGITSVAITSDGTLLVAANKKGSVYLWKTGTEYQLYGGFQAHSTYITTIAISPDDKILATCSADHTAKLWLMADLGTEMTPLASTPKPEKTLTGHQRWVWDCVFSADSNYIITTSSDNSARVWQCSDGSMIRTYTGHQKSVTCVALSDREPEGTHTITTLSSVPAATTGAPTVPELAPTPAVPGLPPAEVTVEDDEED
jgi:G protein beta subunit-like protein